MKKKVLIFTYYFPPAGGVAVQRFLKFSKFLPEFGWEPVIVTVKDGSYPYYDESLLSQVSPQLQVHRTKTFEPFEAYNMLRGKKGKELPVVSVGNSGSKSFFQKVAEYIRANFFIPDARKGWVPYAVECATKILTTEKIDAIITTGPPHSTHLIGLALKRKFGLTWVADFRDPWTNIFYNSLLPRSKASKQKDKDLEDEVLRNADYVTVISPGLKKEFNDRIENIQVIYNGYDEEDFKQNFLPETKEGFTLTYVGNLLASQSVTALWNALARLNTEGYNIKLDITGRADGAVMGAIEAAGIKHLVSFSGFVSHSRAIQLMLKANMLLFIVPDVDGNELILTGKLFEYLGSKSPMLSIGPEDGNAAEILKATGRAPIISYHNEELVYSQLLDAVTRFNGAPGFKFAENAGHEFFTRRNQTAELAALLNRLVNKQG